MPVLQICSECDASIPTSAAQAGSHRLAQNIPVASVRRQRLDEYTAVVPDWPAHAGMAQRTPERHLIGSENGTAEILLERLDRVHSVESVASGKDCLGPADRGAVLQEEGLARGMANLGWTRLPRNPSRRCRTRSRARAPDEPALGIEPRGEVEFGGRNFIELVSALTTPLLMTVRVGIDPTSVRGPDGAWQNLLLPDVVGR